MSRLRAMVALLLAGVFIAAAPPANQAITRGFIYSNIGTLFTWSAAAQSSWSGSHQEATYNDFVGAIKNNGACIPSGLTGVYLITYGYATACAVNSSAHSPILANNSFSGSSSANWTLSDSCDATGFTQSVASGTDQDGDSGYYRFTANANANGLSSCTATISQTFSISGTPSAQSITFWYRGSAPISTGDAADCSSNQNGSASLRWVLNGSETVWTPTLDGTWHSYTATLGALTAGSNTITFATGASAAESQSFNGTICAPATYAASYVEVDNVQLTATF